VAHLQVCVCPSDLKSLGLIKVNFISSVVVETYSCIRMYVRFMKLINFGV
jgi:hypothetical protein